MPPQPCQWCGRMSVNALHADLLKEEEKEQYCLASANSTICITRNADSQRVRAETAESQIKTLLVERAHEITNKNLHIKSLEEQLAFAERIRQDLHELTTQITGKTPEKQMHGLNYIRIIRKYWDQMQTKPPAPPPPPPAPPLDEYDRPRQ